ncbi:hypothetical protein GX586_12070 [bacterium]|nr:hypothetical protein [bacterium]
MTTKGGAFILDGKPWPLHGATYFGRRPGTCGANWFDEHFGYNVQFIPRDIETMHRLGINCVSLFAPGRHFFNKTEPREEMFEKLDRVLELFDAAGIRVILFGARGFDRETWCAAQGIPVPDGLWHPALQPEALRAAVEGQSVFRARYAGRPVVIGYPTGSGRFFRYDFSVPAVRDAWAAWLKERFDGSLSHARKALQCATDERTWEEIRTPLEMEPYFNEDNPRSCEFATMHQAFVMKSSAELCEALKKMTPDQLMFTVMEGCCFSTGHLNAYVPELFPGDAVYTECYHWEGVRSDHIQSEAERRWMREPVAHKPSVDLVDQAGYVQMLIRWMQRSGKPLVVCHGCDIGEPRRGVRDEADQAALIDYFNTAIVAAGAHGICYWCWSDDEQSKTFTSAQGVEYTIDTPPEKRPYWQSGETMGIVRLDESVRPAGDHIARLSRERAGRAPNSSASETLVLFPMPVFQSLYRYRANLTGFGLFTALARTGILAEALWTSAGRRVITAADLAPYKFVILGVGEYLRDHPSVPGALETYVHNGGTLLLPLGFTDKLRDECLGWHAAPALQRLAGAEELIERAPRPRLDDIRAAHAGWAHNAVRSWKLDIADSPCMTCVRPVSTATMLAKAGDSPLLYRHALGEGHVYVFTWNLDVFTFDGDRPDHTSTGWDWLLKDTAAATKITTDEHNPLAQAIRTRCAS